MDKQKVTLLQILTLLQPSDHAYILHCMGPGACEIAASGTVRELLDTVRRTIIRRSVVENLALDKNAWPELQPELEPPVLVITVTEQGFGEFSNNN